MYVTIIHVINVKIEIASDNNKTKRDIASSIYIF